MMSRSTQLALSPAPDDSVTSEEDSPDPLIQNPDLREARKYIHEQQQLLRAARDEAEEAERAAAEAQSHVALLEQRCKTLKIEYYENMKALRLQSDQDGSTPLALPAPTVTPQQTRARRQMAEPQSQPEYRESPSRERRTPPVRKDAPAKERRPGRRKDKRRRGGEDSVEAAPTALPGDREYGDAEGSAPYVLNTYSTYSK